MTSFAFDMYLKCEHMQYCLLNWKFIYKIAFAYIQNHDTRFENHNIGSYTIYIICIILYTSREKTEVSNLSIYSELYFVNVVFYFTFIYSFDWQSFIIYYVLTDFVRGNWDRYTVQNCLHSEHRNKSWFIHTNNISQQGSVFFKMSW